MFYKGVFMLFLVPKVFEYAIRFPDGTYYSSHNVTHIGRGQSVVVVTTSIPMDIYTMTERAAYQNIAKYPRLFEGCAVERVIN